MNFYEYSCIKNIRDKYGDRITGTVFSNQFGALNAASHDGQRLARRGKAAALRHVMKAEPDAAGGGAVGRARRLHNIVAGRGACSVASCLLLNFFALRHRRPASWAMTRLRVALQCFAWLLGVA